MSDEALADLLDRLGGGDLEAAERVFRAYEPYLRKVVRRQLPAALRAKFDSVDVVQSVWADLLEGFRAGGWHFPDAGHLRAFLLTATRNRLIDGVRRHGAALRHETPLEAVPADQQPRAAEDRPSQLAQANELWERLLSLSPPEHRAVLELKRQGLSAREIAGRTRLHEDSVRRILRDLARRLAAQAGPPAAPRTGP